MRRLFTSRSSIAIEGRQALRGLRRAPWYSLTVVAVMALSLSLATTTVAVVEGVLFRPLPYPASRQLFRVGGPHGALASVRDEREWAAAIPTAAMAALTPPFDIGATGDRPVALRAARVGPSFFEVLGVPPLIGGFSAKAFQPAAGLRPALISYELWQREYGGRVDVAGQRLEIAGERDHLGRSMPGVFVAGVLRPDFVYPYARVPPDLLLPLALTPEEEDNRNASVVVALVRAPDDLAPAVLAARLSAVATTQGFPSTGSDAGAGSPFGVSVIGVDTLLRQGSRPQFQLTFWMAAMMLLLAAINVAGLGAARRRQRRQEIAVRRAIGAHGWALLRLAILEVAPLVVAGGLVGLLIAPSLVHAVVRLLPADVLLLTTPRIDARVFAFVALAATTSVGFIGLIHAEAIPKSALALDLGRAENTTPPRGRLTAAVIAAQVALSIVVVVGGALVVGSLWIAWQQDAGFDADGAVAIEIGSGSGQAAMSEQRLGDLMDECRTVPGVDAVGLLGAPFLDHGQLSSQVRRPAGAGSGNEQAVPVAGDFFRAIGLETPEGRVPTPAELSSHAPVGLAASHLWPGRDALGQRLVSSNGRVEWTVVGVVPDVRYSSLDAAPIGQIYRSYEGWSSPTLMVRGRVAAPALLSAILARLRTAPIRPGMLRALTLTDALGETIRVRTFRAWLFGGFAAAALLVVSVGVLGLAAMATAERRREIGIRIALGAARGRVARLCLADQFTAVVWGLGIGSLVAVWTVQWLKRGLYLFTVYDARVWTAAIALVVLAAMSGAIVPALRASRVDPAQTLRD